MISTMYCTECGNQFDVTGGIPPGVVCPNCSQLKAPDPIYSYSSVTFLPNLGWECPRCHKIHAPSVMSCACGVLPEYPKPDEAGWVWVNSQDPYRVTP